MKRRNMLIVSLSSDRLGLRVRTKDMKADSFWHVHSDEMTPYQRDVHSRLIKP